MLPSPLQLDFGGLAACADKAADFVPLFPADGAPKGWSVRAWDDVKNDGPKGAAWKVQDGVLHGSEPRGTWLVSEREYGDFDLEFAQLGLDVH